MSEPTQPPISDPLRQLADRIDRNSDVPFSGAYAILPPKGEAPVTLLLLDSDPSPAMFWGTLKSVVDQKLQELVEQERQGGGPWRNR